MPEIERDAVRLHYETIGDPAHPPVVLLHGFTSDLRMWHPVARFLADSYFLVIPDLRGHGQSASPEGLEAYRMAEYSADLEALANELHLDLFALVGCSFGGMVAMHFAVEHPDRIAALVLSDTSPAYERPEYDDAFRQREERIAAMEDEVRRFGTRLYGKRMAATVADPFAAEGIRKRYERLSTEGLLGAAFARKTRPDLTERLGELSMPVMLVMGMDDQVYCALALMVQRLPAARQVIFRETGHGVPTIHPHDFSDALRQFFHDIQEGRPITGQITV